MFFRIELLQHVVQPSLKVDEKFAAWTAVTNEGQIVNGLLTSDSKDEIVLKQHYAIGIALSAPEGLVVPVVRNADALTFAEIEQ